jgi:hypothetical protein
MKFLSHKPKAVFRNLGHQYYPLYLSGTVLVNAQLEAFFGTLIREDLTLEVFKAVFYEYKEEGLENMQENVKEFKNVFSMNVPDTMAGRKYSDIIESLMQTDAAIVPIALVTMRYSQNSMKGSVRKGRKTFLMNQSIDEIVDAELNVGVVAKPIVITNPLQTMILEKGDRLICFGRAQAKHRLSSVNIFFFFFFE